MADTFQDRNAWIVNHQYDSPQWKKGADVDRGETGLSYVNTDADTTVIEGVPSEKSSNVREEKR